MAHARVLPHADRRRGRRCPLAVVAVALGRLVAAQERARRSGSSRPRRRRPWRRRLDRPALRSARRARALRRRPRGAGALVSWQLARRAPLDRPRALAARGWLVVAVLAWLADAFVLPRLYPPFHVALLSARARGAGGRVCSRAAVRARRSGRVRRPRRGRERRVAWTPARRTRGDRRRQPAARARRARAGARSRGAASRRASRRRRRSRTTQSEAIDDRRRRATARRRARSLDWTGQRHRRRHHRRAARRSRLVLRLRAARRRRTSTPRRARRSLRARVLPDAAHVVLGHVDDDGKVHASAPRAWAPATTRRRGPATCAATASAPPRSIRRRCSSSTSIASARMKAEGLGFEYRKEEFAAPELRRSADRRVRDERAARTSRSSSGCTSSSRTSRTCSTPSTRSRRRAASTPTTARSPTADDEVGDDRRRRREAPPRRGLHRERRSRRGVRRSRRPLPRHHRLRGAGAGAAGRRRARGSRAGVVDVPVQTIDLLPTTLAALDVPLPARVRGRDLGALLAGAEARGRARRASRSPRPTTTRCVARGDDRLVCVRKIASCTLFDVRTDPLETRPIGDRSGACTGAPPAHGGASSARTASSRRTRCPRRCGAGCRAIATRPRTSRRSSTTRASTSAARPRAARSG